MNALNVSIPTDPAAPGPAQAETGELLRCPKCGRKVNSVLCAHCGSRLSPEQSDLYGAVVKQLLRLGGDRTDATNTGGIPGEAEPHMVTVERSQSNNDAPKDNGGAATPQWLFDHCNRLAVAACGEPITLDVAAAESNRKCERYYTKENDALEQDWDAKAAWCNPPYSAEIIDKFVRKAIDAAAWYGTTTCCLLPWWNYPYLDLCEQHGRIHRICNPVSFERQDGSVLTLNNGYHTTSVIVVVFGPTIQAGFGVPIRKNGSDNLHVGITASAIAGNKGTATPKTRVGRKAEIPEEADQEDQPEEGEVTADEVRQEETDKELEEKLREEWLDRLWMLFEQVATNGLKITEEEGTALAAFTERFTDNDRALLVLFWGAWQLARQQSPTTDSQDKS